jgi:hypothetical protein
LKVAVLPLVNFTAVAPVKPVPWMMTAVPMGPDEGEREVIDGLTVNVLPLVAVPPAFVTVILPVVAPAGTVAVIFVLELAVKSASVPLNFTAEAVSKLVPLMVMLSPTTPLVGDIELIVAMVPFTEKDELLVPVPPTVVTEMGPALARSGTVAVILVLELTVKLASAPLN